MGIKDLLKNLEGATVQKNIGDFSGKRLAIDASGWLHKAVFATAEDWVDSNCTDSQLYVDFVLSRVRNLQACGVTPVMVFDGKRNNLKSETRAKRDEGRLSNIENAKVLIEKISATKDPVCRSKMRNECIACFQRGLGVTHDMEKNCLAALRKCNVDIVVAPYEADPQLAYLCHIGYCDGVMSEDSDILVYSAVCGTPFPILYKFEKSGNVQITDLKLCGVFASSDGSEDEDASAPHNDASCTDLESLCNGGISMTTDSGSSSGSGAGRASKKRKTAAAGKDPQAPAKLGSGADGFLSQLQLYFKPSTRSSNSTGSGASNNIVGRRMFAQLCLLAGCDYSDSIPGVGLQTAIQAVVRFKDVSNNLRLKKICDYFKLTGKRVVDTYLPRILRAEQLFYYHPVFNPYSDSITHFTAPMMSEGLEATPLGGGGGVVAECAGPTITEAELFRLGADPDEILTISKKDSLGGSPTNIAPAAESTIRDVCRGHISIKDGQRIPSRYPWECAELAHRRGNSSGWYARRSLMQVLDSGAAAAASASINSSKHLQSNAKSQSVNGHSAAPSRGMNVISSFMLANVSTTRIVGSSANTFNKFASKTVPSSSAKCPNPAPPYAIQQSLSLSRPPTASASKLSYFDSLELSRPPSTDAGTSGNVQYTSHHFQRASSAPEAPSVGRSSGGASKTPIDVDVDDDDDDAMIYDLSEDSMPGPPRSSSSFSSSSSARSPPFKLTVKRSPIKSAAMDEDGPTVYDILDSPPAAHGQNTTIQGRLLGDELSSDSLVPVKMSFSDYLQSHQYNCETEVVSSPSKLQILLSPPSSSSAPSVEPTVTAKKPRECERNGSEDADVAFAHHLQSYALSEGDHRSPQANNTNPGPIIRRKTLGAAPFVPIPRPSVSAATNGGSGGASANAGDKRKNSFAAVPIPRKKTTKGQSSATGSIMVASIKSFFNAV